MFGLFSNPLSITAEEVKAMLNTQNPPKLLDVRAQGEYDSGHLKGALLATPQRLAEVEKWDKETPIVCYCHMGMRSMSAAKQLHQRGFTNVRSMSGGITAWQHASGQVVR